MKQEDIQRALKASDERQLREVARHRGQLLELERKNSWSEMLQQLHQMEREGLQPDSECLDAAVRACGAAGQWRRISRLSADYRHYKLSCDNAPSATLLVEAHARREPSICRELLTSELVVSASDVAPRVIEQATLSAAQQEAWADVLLLHEVLERQQPDAPDSPPLLLALQQAHGHTTGWRAAVRLLLRGSTRRGVTLQTTIDESHWEAALEACERAGAWRAARTLFARAAAAGFSRHAGTAGATIRALANAGEWADACKVAADAFSAPQLDFTRGPSAPQTLSAAIAVAAEAGEWSLAAEIAQQVGRNRSLFDAKAHSLAVVACRRAEDYESAMHHLASAVPLTARTDVVSAALDALDDALDFTDRPGLALALYRSATEAEGDGRGLSDDAVARCLRAAVASVLRESGHKAALELLQAHRPPSLDVDTWRPVMRQCVESGDATALLTAVDGGPHPAAGSDSELSALYCSAYSARVLELATELGAIVRMDDLASAPSRSYSRVFLQTAKATSDAGALVMETWRPNQGSVDEALLKAALGEVRQLNAPLASILAHQLGSTLQLHKFQASGAKYLKESGVDPLAEEAVPTSAGENISLSLRTAVSPLGLTIPVQPEAFDEAMLEELHSLLNQANEALGSSADVDIFTDMHLHALAAYTANDKTNVNLRRVVFRHVFGDAPALSRASYHLAVPLVLLEEVYLQDGQGFVIEEGCALPFTDEALADSQLLPFEATPPNASAALSHACILMHRMRQQSETSPTEETYAHLARDLSSYEQAVWLGEAIERDGVSLSSRLLAHMLTACASTTEQVAILRLAMARGLEPTVGQFAHVALGAIGVGVLDIDAKGRHIMPLRMDALVGAEPTALLSIWEVASLVGGQQRNAKERLERVTDVVAYGMVLHTIVGTQPAAFVQQLNRLDPEVWPADRGLLASMETDDNGALSESARCVLVSYLNAAQWAYMSGAEGGNKVRYGPTLAALARASLKDASQSGPADFLQHAANLAVMTRIGEGVHDPKALFGLDNQDDDKHPAGDASSAGFGQARKGGRSSTHKRKAGKRNKRRR